MGKHSHYHDDYTREAKKGCQLARETGYQGSCLMCPFPKCFEDVKYEKGWRGEDKKEERNKHIVEDYYKYMPNGALMKKYGISAKELQGIINE